MRASRRALRAQVARLIEQRTLQGHTIDALKREIARLEAAKVTLPDLTEMHLDMIELDRTNDRLRADNERLRAQLDNARADAQAAGAFLREGYRSKTGEIL